MAIHLIIDGYNLIRQSPWLSSIDAQDLEAGRQALLGSLASYRRNRPLHKVTVVFDGWQGGGFRETRDIWQGVKVIFSRRGERADEVIKRLLTQERGRALVVSSDRELQHCADGVGATWVEARYFETAYLIATSEDFDEDAEAQPRPRGTKKKGQARKKSKRERQRLQRLKKL
jgi:predicted RNA-binding protein with PIN domain